MNQQPNNQQPIWNPAGTTPPDEVGATNSDAASQDNPFAADQSINASPERIPASYAIAPALGEASPALGEASPATGASSQVTFEASHLPNAAEIGGTNAFHGSDESAALPADSSRSMAATTPVSAPREKSNLVARVITALIGIPLVALLVWRADSAVFNGVIGFLALFSLRELSKALRAAGTPLVSSLAYPALLALLLVQPLTVAHPRLGGMIIWLLPFLLMVLLLISGVQRYPTDKRVSLQSLALTLFATLYVGLFVFFILLRSLRLSPFEDPPLGTLLMWLTVVSVWSGDIVAYFAGRKFGRDKLTPLSPGKTWEGAIAGLVATMVVSVSVARQLQIELQHGLACGILISLAAPLGDLAESFWKRELQIKDSGGVLPGHGGILDRCDSLLFAAFAVYLYALIFIM